MNDNTICTNEPSCARPIVNLESSYSLCYRTDTISYSSHFTLYPSLSLEHINETRRNILFQANRALFHESTMMSVPKINTSFSPAVENENETTNKPNPKPLQSIIPILPQLFNSLRNRPVRTARPDSEELRQKLA